MQVCAATRSDRDGEQDGLCVAGRAGSNNWPGMKRRGLVGVVLLVMAAAVAGCGATAIHTGCVRERQPGGTEPGSGEHVHVGVGTIVYVEQVEDEEQMEIASRFPWLPARSSDPQILREVPLCSRAGSYSLPVARIAFRAVHPGTATILAPLAPAWLSRPPGLRQHPSQQPRPYRTTVTVGR